MRHAHAERRDVIDRERAAALIHERTRNADALALFSRHEPLFELFRNGIHGKSARREERVGNFLLRGKERVLRPFRNPARTEIDERAADVGAQGLVRTDTKLVQKI